VEGADGTIGVTGKETSRVGRHREQRVDHAIVSAARELLVEKGYRALTADAVAERAGIGKAAIYRRYRTKQQMVFAATVPGLAAEPPADTGSLRGDLHAFTDLLVAGLADPTSRATLAGLVGELHSDETLAGWFRTTFVAKAQAGIGELLDRAVRRGELHAQPDPELVNALLIGPIFSWLFLQREVDAERFGIRLATLLTDTLILAWPDGY
jgi:AcrR family transcriptional regulator